MNLMKKTAELAEAEREQLASGQRPAPRFQNKVQRVAFKALAVFFALVLAFTLISRAAVGITVARVDVKKPMTGILTQRTTISGSLAAQGDLELTLPGGIRVNKIGVSVGQRVNAGDVLLEMDQDGLTSAIEKLKGDIALLDLKISGAAKGNSSSSLNAVLNAQAGLKNAQEDYDRLVSGCAGTEERAAEDLAQAQADLDEAKAALEKAKTRAKTELVKAAQEKVDAAKEALATAQTSAKDAIDVAQEAINSAQDQQTTVDSSYFSALNAYNRAKENLDKALAGDDQNAIATAQAALDQAQISLDGADASSNAAYRTLKRAKENLKTVQEKWDAKVKEAEADLNEANTKLSEAQSKTDMSEEALVISAQGTVDNAERALKTAQRGSDDSVAATADQLLAAQRQVESAQRTLDQANTAAAEERANNQSASRQAEVERLGYVNDRREAQKKLDSLLAATSNGGALTAPVTGTVLSIMSETGLTTEGAKVASISRSDQGFEFKGKVTQEEAEKLAVGDEGTISFTVDGKSRDLRAPVTAIGMADDKGMVDITVDLPEGNYPIGASAKFEISKRSETHNTVLPLGALRNDGENYVLVLKEKQTVMGTEQTVEKVPVTVNEKDSESMAVTAPALAYDAQVIVGANKPLAEGDRVRVNENP